MSGAAVEGALRGNPQAQHLFIVGIINQINEFRMREALVGCW
jgi:hypothetical protein